MKLETVKLLGYLPNLYYVSNLAYIGYIIFIVMGAVSANKGEVKPLPVVGDFAKNFDFIKETK